VSSEGMGGEAVVSDMTEDQALVELELVLAHVGAVRHRLEELKRSNPYALKEKTGMRYALRMEVGLDDRAEWREHTQRA